MNELTKFEQAAAAVFIRREAYMPEPNSGCWIWMGQLNDRGYGRVEAWSGGKPKKLAAHRVSYIVHKGPIPPDMVIDHVCMNRACVNPDHLRAVSQRVSRLENCNSPAAKQAKQTHCKRGHPFDEANTYRNPRGERQCRACHAAANRASRQNTPTLTTSQD